MSRVTKRAGAKALVCMACQRLIHGGASSKIRTQFRGKGQTRLDRHIREVHTHPRIPRNARN